MHYLHFIKEGMVAKIKIIRPSATRFFYDPFIIEISGSLEGEISGLNNNREHVGLKIVLGPNVPKSDVDGIVDDDDEEETKLRRINSLIERWQAVGQQQGLWASYSSSIISEIAQNIQV